MSYRSRSVQSSPSRQKTNILAVGNDGTVIRYDGKQWSGVTSGTYVALYAVWGDSKGGVYVVGRNGIILHRCNP